MWKYLEHLNKRHTQIQICHVTTDQTQTEEDTDGDDSAQVNTASHLDGLSAIKEVCGASENLGHEGRESQVPCCKNDGKS